MFKNAVELLKCIKWILPLTLYIRRVKVWYLTALSSKPQNSRNNEPLSLLLAHLSSVFCYQQQEDFTQFLSSSNISGEKFTWERFFENELKLVPTLSTLALQPQTSKMTNSHWQLYFQSIIFIISVTFCSIYYDKVWF